MAKDGCTSQLERIVRGMRRVETLHDRRQSERMEAKREVVTYTDDDGMTVIKARLPPDQGALFLKALESAQRALWDERPRHCELIAQERADQPDRGSHPRAGRVRRQRSGHPAVITAMA